MKTPLIQPYLFFNGRCEEALEFYKAALGAEPGMLMRFKESPEPLPPDMLKPGWEEKVMHTEFKIGEHTLMASDGCGDSPAFGGFSLALILPTEAEVDRAFAALSEGGKVCMPLGKTFWSPRYGMLTDRFGLCWMLMVPAEA